MLTRRELEQRFPMFHFDGVEIGLFEPGFGALIAQRAVQTLVEEFVQAGGAYLQGAVDPPDADADELNEIRLSNGESIAADSFVFAAGAWLPKLFPDVVGSRIRPTRQEVFLFAPPLRDGRFLTAEMPGWADFSDGDMFYGFPDLEGRGVKLAHDIHGPEVDPDTQDRRFSQAALADVVAYRDRRFPALRGAQLTEARVCQYENSSNGDFLVDFHPRWRNVLLVGGGSGHGFKHEARLLPGRTLTSVFFGGGTPSLMDPATVEAIIVEAKGHWSASADIEITLEANPNSVEAARFADLAAAGVNRLSLGLQSFDDRALAFLGRAHSSREGFRALEIAQRNFRRVSFDLIYALPGDTEDGWSAMLAQALSLGTSHLSLYELTIEPGTRFATDVAKRRFEPLDIDAAAALYELTDVMRFRNFVIASTIGTALWTTILAGAGFRLRENFREIDQFIGPVSNAVLIGLALIYVWRLIKHKGED